MSVKCGRCSGYHDSVTDVRACFNGQTVNTAQPVQTARYRATAPQVRYLASLMNQEHVVFKDGHPIEDTERRTASVLIDNLKTLRQARAYNDQSGDATRVPQLHPDFLQMPKGEVEVRNTKSLPNIPSGHYAVPSLTGNNDLDFFRVDRPTEGRWAGRTFVKRVIGGKPDSPVRGKTAREALEAIEAASPDKAAVLYGQEIGRCYRCNRHLTDETSRQLGIGPDCRSRAA